MAWIDSCITFAEARGVKPIVINVLRAFDRGGNVDVHDRFAALESGVDSPPLPIGRILTGEVDATQAQMFSGRYDSVQRMLSSLATRHDEARLFRVGLYNRMREILRASPPRALRVRAVVDFYYSHAALVHHHTTPPTHVLDELIEQATWVEVANCVLHTTIEGTTDSGPLHINLLRTRGRCRCVDARDVNFVELIASEGAVAGVSGGYFLYSEEDIGPHSVRHDPVGLLVSDGVVLGPPFFRRSAFVVADGGISIERMSLVGVTVGWGTSRVVVASVNAVAGPGAAYNRAYATRAPDSALQPVGLVGARVVTVGDCEIPLAGVVILVDPAIAPKVGDAVRYDIPGHPSQAMGAGPLLVHETEPVLDLAREDFAATAPPVTFSADETSDENLLPRMAVGTRLDGEVMFAAVDGRNFERALGMTLRQTADLMRILGCVRAMNLDGGSSKRMVVGGRVVDLPSTGVVEGDGSRVQSVRPVHTSIICYGSGN